MTKENLVYGYLTITEKQISTRKHKIPISTVGGVYTETKKPKYVALGVLTGFGLLHLLPFVYFGKPVNGIDWIFAFIGVLMLLIGVLNLIMARKTFITRIYAGGEKIEVFRTKNGLESKEVFDKIDNALCSGK